MMKNQAHPLAAIPEPYLVHHDITTVDTEQPPSCIFETSPDLSRDSKGPEQNELVACL